ncbi:MAG: hypothetical protein LBI43_04395 [Streptococcaceae bacterium]|jgi:Na+-driven multidrug efflux pump|nr:hypothetical protein [Streptococcaceae bacterium]
MKISTGMIRAFGVVLIVLGILDFVVGFKLPGAWIFGLVLIIAGISLFLRYRKDDNGNSK